MKVMLCHNYYQQRGGEDQSFEDEADLLEAYGHEVIRHTVHNDALSGTSRWKMGLNTFWNPATKRDTLDLLKGTRPDVVHCTNLFPQFSPSIYYAAEEAAVPVVQALRNYRLMCPAYNFLRAGKVCELCATRSFAWPAVAHACYRGSRTASAVVAGSFTLHRLLGTWKDKVAVYFTLTEFARQKFVAGGLPAECICVKENFVAPDTGAADGGGGYAVFVGRLTQEKGVAAMLQGWQTVKRPLALKIIGDGPLADRVRQAAQADPRITWLGPQPLEEVFRVVGDAEFLICPSIWYETFGRVIAEAFSKGTPVIASDLGAMAELVQPGVNGLLFEPGNAEAIGAAAEAMMADVQRLRRMREAARAAYDAKFTAEQNYHRLINIYRRAQKKAVAAAS